MAKSLKEFKEKIVDLVTKEGNVDVDVEEKEISGPANVVEGFDPDIPENKQRHLR